MESFYVSSLNKRDRPCHIETVAMWTAGTNILFLFSIFFWSNFTCEVDSPTPIVFPKNSKTERVGYNASGLSARTCLRPRCLGLAPALALKTGMRCAGHPLLTADDIVAKVRAGTTAD